MLVRRTIGSNLITVKKKNVIEIFQTLTAMEEKVIRFSDNDFVTLFDIELAK